jgi:hypothetical protein
MSDAMCIEALREAAAALDAALAVQPTTEDTP